MNNNSDWHDVLKTGNLLLFFKTRRPLQEVYLAPRTIAENLRGIYPSGAIKI